LKQDSLKSYISASLLTIVLCAAYCLTGGILQFVAAMFISALLGNVYYRHHYGYGILNSLMVLAVFSLFAGVMAAAMITVPLLLLGLSLALGTRFKMKMSGLLLLCTMIYIASLLVGFTITEHVAGPDGNITAIMLEVGRTMESALVSQYPEPELQEMIRQVIRQAVDISIMLAPATFIVFSIVLSYCQIIVFKKMQQKKGEDMAFLVPFEALAGDKTIAVLAIVLFVLLTAAPAGMFASAGLNVLLVLGFIFMVLGMSVFDMKMKRRGMPRFRRRFFLITLVVLSSMVIMLPVLFFTLWGLLDCFFDFRKLGADEEQSDE